MTLNASRDGAPTASLGKLLHLFTILILKNLILMCNLNPPSFSLKPDPPVLPLHTLTKTPFPAFLLAPFNYWKAALWSLWRVVYLRLRNPKSLSLSAQMYSSPLTPLCGPSLKSFKWLHGFLLLGSPGLDAVSI